MPSNTPRHCELDLLLHDLRQPLSRVRLIAQDLRIDDEKGRLQPGALHRGLLEIQDAADGLARCIDHLRAVAAPGSASIPVAAKDAVALCERAVARARCAWPAASIAIAFDGGWRDGVAGPWALEPALWELLCNACQAHAEVGRFHSTVRVDAFVREQSGVVAVSDGGPGVSRANEQRVFRPFFTTREGAAGIGLTVAQSCVQSCGGRVVLIRRRDLGATFEVQWPLARVDGVGSPHRGPGPEVDS